MANRGKASQLSGGILVIVNSISMMLCLFMFAIGLWVVVSPTTLADVMQGTAPVLKTLLPEEITIQLGVWIALLSMFFLFISVMGLYGAVNCSQFLLFMYAALILLLMLLECAVFFYFTSHTAEKGVSGGEFGHTLRLALRCCDPQEISDRIPWSCCENKNCSREIVFSDNCMDAMSKWLHHYGAIVYGTIVASHVVLSSCSLLRRASSASRSHT